MHREMGDFPKNLRAAVNKHCRECNDAIGRWESDNDCQVWRCWLYPYRPGKGGDERKVRIKSEARSKAAKERHALRPMRTSSKDGAKNPCRKHQHPHMGEKA